VNEAIVRAIQDQIQRGDLKAGDRLPPERSLARLFGAGRGSVREALRVLELSGLIDSRHGEGNFVADRGPSAAAYTLLTFLERQRASLLDVFEARKMVEPYLASLAAERATPEVVEKLREASEAGERDLRDGHAEAAVRSDRAFHGAIAAAAGNETLVYLHSYLSDLIASGRRELLEDDARRAQSAVDHRQICQAIARGDGAAARAAMLRHLENVQKILMDAVLSYQRVASLLPGAGVAKAGGARAVSRASSGPARARQASAFRLTGAGRRP
jgi:GntR family transcriptional repressor for pyruvate dehydrogenase complex